jgi:CelD/BcsL family acetyltransferase involved in cellulose biosynthesis
MDTATIAPVAQEDMGAPQAADTGIRIEVIRDYDAFMRLEPTWNRLVDEAGIDHPFIRHEWVRTWWECFEHGAALHIVVVKEGEEPIAIAPLMLDRGRVYGWPVRRLRGIANVYTERFDFILPRRAQDACGAIWKYLSAKAADWDVLELRQLPENARAMQLLPHHAVEDRFLVGQWPSSQGPYIPVNQPWDAYLKTLSKKHLSNLRGRAKGLHRIGSVRLEIVTGGEQLERALNEAFLLEAAAWKGQAGTAILNRPDRQAFYRQLMTRAAERGWMRLHFLTLDGKRIAVQLALLLGKKLYILKTGYDPHYAQFAPSLVLCEMTLHEAWKQSLAEVDLLGDAERWKLDWAAQTRPHSWLFIFPNRRRTRLLHRLKFSVLPRLHRHPFYRAVRDAGCRVGLKAHGD